MRNYPFGISSWSYPWSVGVASGPQPERKMTAFDLVRKAHELEVGLVQIADNLPLEKLKKPELEELASFAKGKQVLLEVGTKGTEKEHLLRFLEIARILGSPIVRTLPALFGKKAVLEEVEQNIRNVLPYFEEAGICIVLENTEAFRADQYVALMESVQHPNFKMCVDLANALGIMEGPEYVLPRFLPHCGNYHFKDVLVKRSETLVGFSVEGRPSGQGQLPLPWILEKLDEAGVDTSIILELWPPFENTIEKTLALEDKWVRESVAYMKSALG